MFTDRRKHQRHAVVEQLTLRFNEDEYIKGSECSDISLGGMCVLLDDAIPTDDRYGIVFLAEKCDDDLLFFESKFVKLWENKVFVDRHDVRMGIKFIDIDPKNYDNLCRIVGQKSEVAN